MCDSTFVEILANLDSINERAPRISVRDENLEAHKRNILSVLADRLSNEYTAAELEDYLRSEIASRSGSPRETNYDYSEDHIRFLGCQGSRSIPKLAESTRAQILKRCKELSSNRTDILKLRLRRSCSSLPRHDDSPQSPNRASLKTRRSAGVKKNMLKSERKPKRRSRGHRTVSFDPKYVDQPRSRDETGEIAETPSFSQDPSPVPVRSIRSESTYVARDDLAHSPQTRAAPLTRSDLDDIGEIRSLSQNYQETRYHQVLNRLTHYMSLYEEAKQEVSRLKNTLRDIDSAKGVPENWLSMLAESRNHVSVLKQQGADRSALKKLFACKELTAENYEDRDIVSSFELLQGSLKRIQILGGDTKLRIADVCNVSKDLDELLSITFGTDSRDFSQEKVDLGPELSLYDIIQALVGAAIHSWIFSTEYCPFAITPVPLLQEYRRQISAIYGPETLHNLDHATHRFLLTSEEFGDTDMQQMSNALMDRLLQALEHLFDYEDREEAVQQVRSSLSTCIKAALQIRSISLTSPYSFESLWFPTGSPLRREQMEWAYEESGVNVSTMRISLCPGLFAYEKEESMVQHDGWIKTERLEREPKFTIKAVVLP